MGKITIANSQMSDTHSGVLELTSKKKTDLEMLNGKAFATDDPSLILILNVLHGHEVISTGYLEGFHNTHFVFEQTKCLDTHIKHWDEIAQDDCDGYLNVFLYMVAFLGKPEKESFSALMQDLGTFDKEVDN